MTEMTPTCSGNNNYYMKIITKRIAVSERLRKLYHFSGKSKPWVGGVSK